ncbi:MAG: metallo-mystery pair system four-Cys motif protein [Archangiaceae bacterium]|nr:metallo-mystery pair system four-Cys motif protein [Archangiaceae bacterium]
MTFTPRASLAIAALALCFACGRAPEAFSMKFAALVDGKPVGCTDAPTGFGTSGATTIGINDLRFYLSNLKLLDSSGKEVETTLDEDAFQLASAQGQLSLVDLTGNSEGSCGATMLGGGEGTGRTHPAITGKTRVADVKTVSFEVGVPQPVMKKVIAENTPEGAPSPLAELYWNWSSGYRHFIFNFTINDGSNGSGEGYLHIGSRDCGPMAGKALEDRDSCTYVNNPSVTLSSFDLTHDTVGIDLKKVLQGLDFVSPKYDANFNVIGQGPGVECHSSPDQPDCPTIFSSFGLDIATGKSTTASNAVFVRATP